jgi:hypothetical protein
MVASVKAYLAALNRMVVTLGIGRALACGGSVGQARSCALSRR